ncbi:hypothetical protein CEXT_261151 [Caerostris extrusa]|uniref:Uncharacterized protein n=1 Tax=Caerostris extrusa TaxID=172846 RepID=A0AAV4U0C0_CAEEX|nr:hypothetical protein CEXT_261151 [Caerostris extrusa]
MNADITSSSFRSIHQRRIVYQAFLIVPLAFRVRYANAGIGYGQCCRSTKNCHSFACLSLDQRVFTDIIACIETHTNV